MLEHSPANSNNLPIHAMKLGERTRVSPLLQAMLEYGYTVQRIVDVGQIVAPDAVCFVFFNGIVINWGKRTILDRLLQHRDDYVIEPIEPIEDELSYWISGDRFTIEHDVIILPEHDPRVMLSVSYALVKELQLSHNEQIVDAVAKQSQPLATELSLSGKITMKKKQIKQLIGHILAIQFNLSATTVIQDKPDLFWEEPNLEKYYIKVVSHLDLAERAVVVQQKLHALSTTAEILRDETNTHSAHVLEWVVILLIAWEILFSGWEYAIQHFYF